MAQAHREEGRERGRERERLRESEKVPPQPQIEDVAEEKQVIKEIKNSISNVPFKFNVQAPEFVPRSLTQSQSQSPPSAYIYPYYSYIPSDVDWYFLGDNKDSSSSSAAAYLLSPTPQLSPTAAATTTTSPSSSSPSNKHALSDDLRYKIVKQVEFQFSDMSLLANESLSKQISKDPDGYVPISFVASSKKLKSLVNNNHLLTQALRSSSKLIISEDGKKVKRKHPFTEKDREEMLSRTVIAENLPDDHYHQSLEKIFNVVGSVKSIRVCHPQDSNSPRSKGDFFLSGKLHALVEYESSEAAERATEKLNDERNWRKGLRVRSLLRCSPKSVLKGRRSEFDGVFLDDGDTLTNNTLHDTQEDCSQSQPCNTESAEHHDEDNALGAKKGWAKGRGKGRGRGQSHGAGRGVIAASPQSGCNPATNLESSPKPAAAKGPRMPDGTRGFTMGRGKPLTTP